jgi:hypothetical protein
MRARRARPDVGVHAPQQLLHVLARGQVSVVGDLAEPLDVDPAVGADADAPASMATTANWTTSRPGVTRNGLRGERRGPPVTAITSRRQESAPRRRG